MDTICVSSVTVSNPPASHSKHCCSNLLWTVRWTVGKYTVAAHLLLLPASGLLCCGSQPALHKWWRQLNKHPDTASLSSLFYFPSLISRSCCLGSKPQIKYCASTSRGLQERKWERAIHFPTLKRAVNIQVKIIIGQNSTCNYHIKSDHRVSVLGLNRKDPRGLFKDQILLLKAKSFNETEKYFK